LINIYPEVGDDVDFEVETDVSLGLFLERFAGHDSSVVDQNGYRADLRTHGRKSVQLHQLCNRAATKVTQVAFTNYDYHILFFVKIVKA